MAAPSRGLRILSRRPSTLHRSTSLPRPPPSPALPSRRTTRAYANDTKRTPDRTFDLSSLPSDIKPGDKIRISARDERRTRGATNAALSTEEGRRFFEAADAPVTSEMDELIERTAPPEEPGQPPPNTRDSEVAKEVDDEITEEFDSDDISSTAHAELEQVRELREFNRVVAWDMPLLWEGRKEFVPPAEEQVLRWRYTTYMGEVHEGSRKVVVDFAPGDMKQLGERQVGKMIKLLGPRFDPMTGRAKMSSQRFPTVAQNKRFLGDMVDKLIAEAKDERDMFEDVPFDFRASRHVVRKRRERELRRGFPEAWKMTEQRRAELEARRTETRERENRKVLEGTVVDGVKLIAQAMVAEQTEVQRQPAMERVRR
ncbi:MAG: 37S ribosomal protein S24, mitochondrial [Chrysothrix sp. TS-e1954]|nr:MAG: 37S ribosomal protein S24, mitochondrial [Chrysothrix sp. TS-e1954]